MHPLYMYIHHTHTIHTPLNTLYTPYIHHCRYCYHNELDIHRVEDGSFMLKGWFPLHNKHWRNNHKCGEIEMEI